MCPKCKKDTITRFGPYDTDHIFSWLFACQSIDGGCGKWWTESNNPFQYHIMHSIEAAVRTKSKEKKVLSDYHNEWRAYAGLPPVSSSDVTREVDETEIDDEEIEEIVSLS